MNRYEALQHAVKAHSTQLDKGGLLYVLHPIAVANRIEAPSAEADLFADVESAVIVALLHDVLEDTSYMLDPDDFTQDQWVALMLVTHQKKDDYASYIAKIAIAARHGSGEAGRLAAIVKLADLSHNLSPERQKVLPEKTQQSLEKRYLKARASLWDALGSEWWPA